MARLSSGDQWIKMARPREFDHDKVLDAAMRCFWLRGFEGTSVRDLQDETGLTGASLYNAFGNKQSLYEITLDRYVRCTILQRIERCQKLAPVEAIREFFADILQRSLSDKDRKGCMLVNATLEPAPFDARFRTKLSLALSHIEMFFLDTVRAGQFDSTITHTTPAEILAQHLLGVLMGVRVLGRVRAEEKLLCGVVAPAIALLTREPMQPS
ncbi:TetR/AcrR family transcriptional regulator [Brucella intermedia]|uniref:TetR/AcrR family transcriptional regulator n=1 Tax=Brucella intermedia TaxID=94625 RepID=UPI003AB3F410